MTSYEDAYRQMHAHWHGYPVVTPQQTSPSLPYSSPSPYHPHPPNAVPYYQDLQPSPLPGARGSWSPRSDHYVPRTRVDHYTPPPEVAPYAPPTHRTRYTENAPPPTSGTAPWRHYEPLKREQDSIHHSEYDELPRVERDVDNQGITTTHRPAGLKAPPTYNSQGPLHLPGATQYLQRRESQNGSVPRTAHSPAVGPSGSTVRVHHKERTPSTRPEPERSINARPSKRPSATAMPGADSMSSQPLRSSQASPKRPAQASGPPRGTQHAPFEILSSPEPEIKRLKTTNTPPSARAKQREPPKPTGPTNYDGFSRQEITCMLVEPTNVKPKKMRYYAVAIGRRPGVYNDWATVEKQVHGFHGARHKKFKTEEEALDYMKEHRQHLSSVQPGYYSLPPRYEQYSHSARASQPTEPTRYNIGLNPDGSSSEWAEGVLFDPPSSRLIRPPHPQAELIPADADQNYVPEDDGPMLVPEQQHVVDLIVQGHNVFYTGSAGCGKSTILKTFVKQLQQKGKRVKIVAPTNLAALNVGGQTTWNFAGWTPDSMKIRIDKLMENSRGKESFKKFDETDVLVIDEISMIENLQFERLNMIMKASRGQKYGGGAFGGVQLIVTGDFYQLAPVKPFARCMCGWELEKDNKNNPKEYKCTNRDCREHTFYDIDKWAFRSQAWQDCDFKHVNLTQIHRQSDMMFKSILNRIRTDGKILPPHANVLLNHTSETEGAIMLFARRFDVDRVNNENIAKIQSVARIYRCLDDFYWSENHRSDKTLEKNTYRLPDGSLSALKEHRFEIQVQLKLNQRVVLQANLDPAVGLVNGAQGTVVEFKAFDEKELPKAPVGKNEGGGDLRGDHAGYREAQLKAFADANGRRPWPVVQFTNGLTRTIFADCTVNVLGNEEPYCKLSRTQIPLAAGYAITVHKSQGMTLDRVTVDLARAFEPSQIYVALSRARSLKGLTVSALPRFDLGGANAQVKEFMESIVAKKNPTP